MTDKNNLLEEKTIKAYKNRFEKMQKYGFSPKGNELFQSTTVATSEQVHNLHVEAKVNDLIIDCDGPAELGGTQKGPGPMPLLLACLANCLEITALLYLSFSNVNVKSVKVEVQGTFDKRSALDDENAPLPGFYNLKCSWYIETEENKKKIEDLLKEVERVCPVRGTIAKAHKFSREIVIL